MADRTINRLTRREGVHPGSVGATPRTEAEHGGPALVERADQPDVLTAGEYRKLGFYVDPAVKDDEIPGAIPGAVPRTLEHGDGQPALVAEERTAETITTGDLTAYEWAAQQKPATSAKAADEK